VKKTCRSSVSTCSPVGAACASATECCNLSCTNGRCGAAACVSDNGACAVASDCCSGTCEANKCTPLSTTCKTAGNACGASSECCSKLCQGGKCALGASYCIQPGDVCYDSADCCTGLCDKAAGKAAGVCKTLETTGSGSCVQDGIVCAGCTNCCSRVCAPYGRSGVSICQPASGCRVTNNVCQKDGDCCGGDVTLNSGAQKVTCNLAAAPAPGAPPAGTCSNPNGCQARGNVCGLKEASNACGNSREDCCDCLPPKFNCCKADSLGVPRCFGGSTAQCPSGYTGKEPCCIKAGETCQFASECCGGTPCVPDAQGVLRCLAKPPTGAACVAAGAACTTTGDCCSGLVCNISAGQAFGSCAQPPPPPPPPSTGAGGAGGAGGAAGAGGAGGVGGMGGAGGAAGGAGGTGGTGGEDAGASGPDAAEPPPPPPPPPVCSFYGQSCSTTVTCCNDVPCTDTATYQACTAGSAACACFKVVQ
jgi:hypothetical protein